MVMLRDSGLAVQGSPYPVTLLFRWQLKIFMPTTLPLHINFNGTLYILRTLYNN